MKIQNLFIIILIAIAILVGTGILNKKSFQKQEKTFKEVKIILVIEGDYKKILTGSPKSINIHTDRYDEIEIINSDTLFLTIKTKNKPQIIIGENKL